MLSRYEAQKRVPEIGEEGQKKLGEAHILIIGCGALGSPVAMYLAGAGIGSLTLADFDTVDLSNLHRQVFFQEEDLGKGKASRLRQRINALNREISVSLIERFISVKELEGHYDAIVDAADNPATTYMIDDFCRKRSIPYVSAGVAGWDAQIFTYCPGSFSYRDIFPMPAEDTGVLPCSLTGIVGATAAFAASLQCAEIIKIILGIAGSSSALISANLLTGDFMKSC